MLWGTENHLFLNLIYLSTLVQWLRKDTLLKHPNCDSTCNFPHGWNDKLLKLLDIWYLVTRLIPLFLMKHICQCHLLHIVPSSHSSHLSSPPLMAFCNLATRSTFYHCSWMFYCKNPSRNMSWSHQTYSSWSTLPCYMPTSSIYRCHQ